MKKQAWLNIKTGEFSDSWLSESREGDTARSLIDIAEKYPEWKLIEFECLSDTEFEFTRHMKLR